MKLITKDAATKLMAAYDHSAKTGEGGKEVLAKFFTPWANATWYVTEGVPVTESGDAVSPEYHDFAASNADKYDWHLFGFCDLGDKMNAELGYVMLSDLKGLNGPFGLKVERDLYYSGTLAEVLEEYGRAA
jgi:hypothetical protein